MRVSMKQSEAVCTLEVRRMETCLRTIDCESGEHRSASLRTPGDGTIQPHREHSSKRHSGPKPPVRFSDGIPPSDIIWFYQRTELRFGSENHRMDTEMKLSSVRRSGRKGGTNSEGCVRCSELPFHCIAHLIEMPQIHQNAGVHMFTL